MLKQSGYCLATLILSSWAAHADVVVNDILLRQQGENMNVRVVVGNPAARTQKGPVQVKLFVRTDAYSAWKQVMVWNNIAQVKSGDKVARDLFGANSAVLRNTAQNPRWQARATVTAPGAKSAEKIVTSTGDIKK